MSAVVLLKAAQLSKFFNIARSKRTIFLKLMKSGFSTPSISSAE